MRIVLTGGGSGGHLIPFEPIVDALRHVYLEQKDALPRWIDKGKLQIYFLGVSDQATRDFFQHFDVRVIDIPAAKLRRYPSPRTLSDVLFRLPIGLIKALWQLWWLMPDAVISKGGYGSMPVALAATFYRIPFLLHESDAVSGLANRLMASLAAVVTVGFAATRHEMLNYKSKTIVTGTPVRKQLLRDTPVEAKRYFGFDEEEPVLLVTGGSQGAEQLNELVLEVLPSLIEDMGIIHLTGLLHFEKVHAAAKELLMSSSRSFAYRPFGYLTDDIGWALTASDMVVSRAGATALAELAFLRKPAVVIPLATAAQDHQRENAAVYDAAGAVRLISPENLGRALFEQNVRAVMFDKTLRDTLSTNITRLSHPRAAHDIADLAFKLALGLQPFQPKNAASSKEQS